MKKVIDANYLQDDRLAHWLSSSSNNYAVLTDYSAMEAYKGDTLVSIFKSMEILSRYPDQVLVLKNTRTVCGLESDTKGLQCRLLDEAQTKGFRRYCSNLRKAKEGDVALREKLLYLGVKANEHMACNLGYAEIIREAIGQIRLTYSKEERSILRTRQPLTNAIGKKLLEHVVYVTATLLEKHPQVQVIPTSRNFSNAFIFRYALCSYLNTLDWISDGGARGTKPETIRNDMVDTNYAAFATYFDGLLSKDKKAILIYQRAKYLLNNVFIQNESVHRIADKSDAL
jgi:hypothetical protein